MGRFGRKIQRQADKQTVEELKLGLSREHKKIVKKMSIGQTIKAMVRAIRKEGS